ncbi:hypothetical protein ACMFMG_007410 [Clarireedia jacksonii]
MPPRLQCLNAVQIAASKPNLRLPFSTTRAEYADPPTASSSLTNNQSSLDAVTRLIAETKQRKLALEMLKNRSGPPRIPSRQDTIDDIDAHTLRGDLSKLITRKWKAGDVYAPHDLSDVEMAKWRKKDRITLDVFDVLKFKPLEQYKNFSVLSEYMTTMGRIKGSKETGLRPVNQRKIAKAIRRSIGMGLMPSVHRHPAILYKMRQRADIYNQYRPGPL